MSLSSYGFSAAYILAHFVRFIWYFVLRITGVAIGVGLGLGYAIHIRDTLEHWKRFQEQNAGELGDVNLVKNGNDRDSDDSSFHNRRASSKLPSSSGGRSESMAYSTSILQKKMAMKGMDGKLESGGRESYQNLMLEAGYPVPAVFRGQLTKDIPSNNCNLSISSNHCNKGELIMKEMFPQLPAPVNKEIGQIIDLVMRDYIASWYSTLDNCVVYNDPTVSRDNKSDHDSSHADGSQYQGGGSTVMSSSSGSSFIYSTKQLRTAPFMDIMYDVLAYLFGNISSTCMDRMNVVRFIVIKVVDALAKTLKVYRLMRERAVCRSLAYEEQQKFKQSIVSKVQAQKDLQEKTHHPQAQQSQASARLRQAPPQRQHSQQLPQLNSALVNARHPSSVELGLSGGTLSGDASTSVSEDRSKSDIKPLIKGRTDEPENPQSGRTTGSAIKDQSPNAERQPRLGRRLSSENLKMGVVTSSNFTTNRSLISSITIESITNGMGSIVSLPQQSDVSPLHPVSEIAVAREFLLGNYLHKALTFGMDINSLLQANVDEDYVTEKSHPGHSSDDSDSEERVEEISNSDQIKNFKGFSKEKCAICQSSHSVNTPAINSSGRRYSADTVLTHRLFHSGIVEECELDYNRMIACQLFKKIMPMRECGSFIIKSMGVEMLAGCVLVPSLSMFCPSFFNYLTVQMLSTPTPEILAEDADWRKNTQDRSDAKSVDVAVQPSYSLYDTNSCVDDKSIQKTEIKDQLALQESVSSVDNQAIDQENIVEEKIPRLNQSVLVTPEAVEHDLVDKKPTDNQKDGNHSMLPSQKAQELSQVSSCDDDGFLEDIERVKNNKITPSTQIPFLSTEKDSEFEGDLDEDETSLGSDFGEDQDSMIQDVDENSVERDRDEGSDGDLNTSRDEFNDGMHLLPLTTIAVSEVEACAEIKNEDNQVDWDTEYAKASVCHLVLVIEAVLFNGRKTMLPPTGEGEAEMLSLTMVVMEMTADLEGFEAEAAKRQIPEYQKESSNNNAADDSDAEPDPAESSTLRTVIATWLQTGHIYKMLSAFSSSEYILKTYYKPTAFLNQSEARGQFLRQIVALDEVEVLVDTLRALGAENTLHKRPLLGDDSQAEGQVMVAFPPASPIAENPDNAGDKKNAVSMLRPWCATNPLLGAAPSVGVAYGANNAVTAVEKKLSNVRNQMAAKRQGFQRWVNNKPGAPEGEKYPEAIPVDTTSASKRNIRSVKQPVPAQTALSFVSAQPLPAYLNFHRNESFASNLRTERDRRQKSWITELQREGSANIVSSVARPTSASLSIVCRPENEKVHSEMHQLAHLFYKSTVATRIAIQPGKVREIAESESKLTESSTKENQENMDASTQNHDKDSEKVTMKIQCTMEIISARRKIEVPDEDSSFLLRAQPRDLVPVGLNRDQRNPGKSHKVYAATYEVPILCGVSKRYLGARYIRPCLLRYFPTDKTAAVQDMMPSLETRLNETKPNDLLVSPGVAFRDVIKIHSVGTLPSRFSSERHPCLKTRAGVSYGPMETLDFAAVPRTGRAIDFVYKMSLFEKPVVELAGKRFSIHDNTKIGAHRADASSRELSDASLSYIIIVGGDAQLSLASDLVVENVTDSNKEESSTSSEIVEAENSEANQTNQNSKENTQKVMNDFLKQPEPRMLLKMRVVGANNETTETSKVVKPSFIRAALMVTTARQDAQLQCLVACVKAGSARQATKSRAEALLRPTASLLEFAASRDRAKEQALLRDVGLGITHIDREQLRRNGMVDPREPYTLRRLKVKFEDVFLPAATLANAKPSPVFEIRCLALTEQCAAEQSESATSDSRNSHSVTEYVRKFYREEWMITRPFKDIVAFHKHLKAQVGEAPRFSLVAGAQQKKVKVALVPVLNYNAAKNALTTKKALDRRKLMLNQYFEALLSPSNLLSFSPEVLRFLAANEPVPENLQPYDSVHSDCGEMVTDSLGRTSMRRVLLKVESMKDKDSITNQIATKRPPSNENSQAVNDGQEAPSNNLNYSKGQMIEQNKEGKQEPTVAPERAQKLRQRSLLTAYIKSRVENITLAEVRNSIFDLLRSMFDLDSASFMRAKLFSAIRAMAYLVIGEKDFNKLLIKVHLDYLTGTKIAQWIADFRETMWPNGVWYTKKPDLTDEEEKEMELKAKDLLRTALPDQLHRVLGDDLNAEGMAMLHEMLQNRLVLKSFGYMIVDMVWLEIFPGMSDILSGTASLERQE